MDSGGLSRELILSRMPADALSEWAKAGFGQALTSESY